MRLILVQVSSCINFITLGDDEGEDHIEDEDHIIKTIINLTIKSTKYQGISSILNKSLFIFFLVIN
jgi:hypothetical protein